MAERPILFSTPMVESLFAGCKTQTRRVITKRNSLGIYDYFDPETAYADNDKDIQGNLKVPKPDMTIHPTAVCKTIVDDIFWVRETCQFIHGDEDGWWVYKADDPDGAVLAGHSLEKWCPSIFMPKKACRLFLKVNRVWPERINDISEADAKREGVGSKAEFKKLWDSINKKRGFGWDVNPWCWCYEFERVEGLNND